MVASQKNPESKVQVAHDHHRVRYSYRTNLFMSTVEHVLHLEFDCKNTRHTQRFHPAKQPIQIS
eukprot:1161787-Pelagomonas_calceolata.AAC.5